MENNYPKDPIEEGKPPLDLEDDEDFYINNLYPEDDPEMDYYDSLDDELEDDEDDYKGLDDICAEEDADKIFAEQMGFYDPMDEDD